MMKENLQMYINRKEPGTQRGRDETSYKQPGGPPKSKQRMKLRREVKAKGPIELLIETMHVNGANLGEHFKIRQFNQATLDIVEDPFQDIKSLWKQAVIRNRTAAVSGTRKETEGLREIDDYASRPVHNKFGDEDRMLLEIMRTGAAWDKRKAYWAGRAEACNGGLCGEGKEGLTHTIWTCKALHEQRCEIDQELAECMGEETLPKALLYGIAPAMAADYRKTPWGGERD